MPASKKKSSELQMKQLAKHVEESIKLLDKVAAMVTANEPVLTAAQRKGSLKMKAGGEKVVPVLAALATRFEVSIGSHPVPVMLEKVQHAQTLLPLLERAGLLRTQLNDALLRANADAWKTATVLYGTLKSFSSKNGDVGAALAPVEEYFARRHKSVAIAKRAKANGASNAGVTAPSGGAAVAPAPIAAVPSGHA